MFRWLTLPISALLLSCGSPQEVTTRSPYTSDQVRDLEIRAIRNDRDALRDLQMHYDFEGDDKKSEKIKVQRLKLRDPEALSDQMLDLVASSKKSKDCAYKKVILAEAMALAVENAKYYKITDTSTYDDVRIVQREVERLKC